MTDDTADTPSDPRSGGSGQDVSTPISPADTALVELIATVGHDLRSPLTSVLGYAQLLDAEALTEEQHRHVGAIERNGRRLLCLIDELMVSVQLASGERSVTWREVDLAQVARSRGDELGPTAQTAGVSLTVVASDPVPVSGDPELLAQAIDSVLSSAIKLTPRGGAVTMRVGLRDGAAREAVIEVADTGLGMGPDELSRLTGWLYRARGADGQQARGIGLGLPVAQAIVDAHGGTLGVESTLGEGTRVTVTLAAGSSAEAGSTPR